MRPHPSSSSFAPPRSLRRLLPLAVLALFAVSAAAHAAPHATSATPGAAARPIARRALVTQSAGRWIGDAIAYGPHRDGQAPGALQPSDDELREDLRLMARRWGLIRVYGSTGPTERMLAILRAERLPLRVLLGVWIAREERRDSTGAVVETFPAARAANQTEIDAAVRLAAAYPELVWGISVGNETQVAWSDHRVPPALLLGAIRSVRERTRVPVTTADDFNFWNKPESRAVADEVDFVMMHAHPMWNGRSLDDALDWTARTVASIRGAHPRLPVVLGETGWATRRHTEGEQATLIRGTAGEAEQKVFFDRATAWARRTRTVTLFFEAFDENWKGGAHPDEVEKHWGLYRADRTPKAAVASAP